MSDEITIPEFWDPSDDLPVVPHCFTSDDIIGPPNPPATGLPSAVDLDPKNPARGLKKLDEYVAKIDLERARTERYKAQKAVKEAEPPRRGLKPETKAWMRQGKDETKRDGVSLIDRVTYLGKNRWLVRRGADWVGASQESDCTITAEISNRGYMSTGISDLTWESVWLDDAILKHAPRRSNLTEVDFVLQHLKDKRYVEAVWEAANYPHGVFELEGQRILNKGNYAVMAPSGTSLPECWNVYTQALLGDQRERVLGLWRETLKRAQAGGLINGWFQPAGLALVSGIGGIGKSRLFHYIARSLGGKSAAPVGGYIGGDVLGSSHLLQCPVVELSDASVLDRDVRQAQTRLLNLISNSMKEIRLMRHETMMMPLSPFVCVSLNSDNVDCTKVFYGLPQTVKEKWIVVPCGNGKQALHEKGFTFAELESTLPSMVGYLLGSETPPEFLEEVVDGLRQPARFLVGHYFDPVLDLEWSPLGDLAPLWEDLQRVVRTDPNPPTSRRYRVSELRKLLLTIRDEDREPSYRSTSPRAFAEVLGQLHRVIPNQLHRVAVGNPKSGGWYEYELV